MDDLIRRSDAIEVLYREKRNALAQDFDSIARGIQASINCISELPTIEPKQGEWIVHKDRTTVGESGIDFYPIEYVCSCCGFKESMYFIDREPYNYCPNCGADMREREGE